MSRNIPVNLNINPAGNGWIIFITPKFIENSGDRTYVAQDVDELCRVVAHLAYNQSPVEPHVQLEWPYEPEDETLHTS